jgi:hypothetical protein
MRTFTFHQQDGSQSTFKKHSISGLRRRLCHIIMRYLASLATLYHLIR